jgi:hypothetical protein
MATPRPFITWGVVLALVDAQARLGHALDALDDRAAGVVLELHLELGLRALALDLEAVDVALVLQHLAIATLSFDDGIVTDFFSTRCALRMRVNMSAIGSLMLMSGSSVTSSP